MIYIILCFISLLISCSSYVIGNKKGYKNGYKEGYEKSYLDSREDKEVKILEGIANILNYTGEVKKNG